MAPPISSVYSQESIHMETVYPTSLRQFNQSYNVYHDIYEFIINSIVLKSDIFSSYIMIDEDEDGNPSIKFYIKHADALTYAQRKKLTYEVLEKLYNFCTISDFQDKFHDVSIFLIKQEVV